MRYFGSLMFLIACVVCGPVNASERISGLISLTAGSTDIGPKSAKYDFNNRKIKATIKLDETYFLSFSRSTSKHSSTGKNDTNNSTWYKVGYQMPLSGRSGTGLLSDTKVFASIGYFTSDWEYAGRIADTTASGTSYSIGAETRLIDEIELKFEFTPAKYNSGSLNGKTQRVTDLSATYFLNDKIGLSIGYRDVDSRWAGSVDAKGWSTGIEFQF